MPSGFIVKRVAQAWAAPSAMASSQKKIRTCRGLRRGSLSSRDASLTDVWGGDRAALTGVSPIPRRGTYLRTHRAVLTRAANTDVKDSERQTRPDSGIDSPCAPPELPLWRWHYMAAPVP